MSAKVRQTKNNSIRVLPAQLANQIAAGEVVERPASVVKELVENSLDAGATKITVDIEQGGHKSIIIRDNGCGIEKDQLKLALSRHATSKISSIDDLESLSSMGFRGEALASISSVSRLSLISKPSQQAQAWQAVAEGMDMDVEISPVAHPDGSSIIVNDLFFNTPARRKFLRSKKTEFQHIEQALKRLALTRTDVQFTFVHNKKTIFKLTASGQLSKRIEQICGMSFVNDSVEVKYQFDGIRVYGFASALGRGQLSRDQQYIFVNNRVMKDKVLMHAIRQVYEETLPADKFASFVLFLELPSDQLDINVHPAKHEVRFHQARTVHDVISRALNQALGTSRLMETESPSPNHDYIRPLQTQNSRNVSDQASEQYGKNFDETTKNQGALASSNFSSSRNYQRPQISSKEIQANYNFLSSMGSVNSNTSESTSAIDTLEYQTLYCSGYFVVSDRSQLRLLPIVALLSYFFEHIASQKTRQILIMPVAVNATFDIKTVYLDALEKLGLSMTKRKDKWILRDVPITLKNLPWVKIFPKFLELIEVQIVVNKNDLNIVELLAEACSIELQSSDNSKQADAIKILNSFDSQSLKEVLNHYSKCLDGQDLDSWFNNKY